MKIPSTLALFCVCVVGCDLSKMSVEEPEEEEAEVVATGDRWWEDDPGEAGSDDPAGDGMGQPGAADDTAKPDDAEDALEDSFEVELDLETGQGSFGVDFTDCRLRGEIVDGTEATPCSDCSMAMSMKIGSVSIEEASGCGDFMDSGSDALTYGHGTEELFEFEGVKLHALFEQVDGEWSVVDDGYSIVIDTKWIIAIDLAE